MPKMTSCCAFLFASLVVAAPAYAKDAPPNTAILDRGILTQASAMGVVRINVASAALEIQYVDGRVYRDVIPVNRRGAMDTLVRTPFWILGGAVAEKAICTEEARNAADALDLVTRACAGGQSAFCTDARETLGSALAEFNDCLSQAFQGGGGSSGGQSGQGGQNTNPSNPPGGGGQPPGGGNGGQPEN